MTQPSSAKQTLALTAAGTAILTAGAILGGQALRRYVRTEKLKESIGRDLAADSKWGMEESVDKDTQVDGLAAHEVEYPDTKRHDPLEREWKQGQYDEGLIREQASL